MSRISCAVFVILISCLLVKSGSADDKPAAPDQTPADEKPAQTVKGFGDVIDPDGDCQIQEQIKVTITVPKTTHDLALNPEYTKQNAPRITQDVKGDFSLAIKVDAFPIPKPKTSSNGRFSHVGAGLLIWQDDKNYIRMERSSEGDTQSRFVMIECYQDGIKMYKKHDDIEDKNTYLRVTRSGDNFTFESGEDGQDWTKLTTEEVKLAEQLKVGIAAVNTTTEEFSSTFQVPKPIQSEK
ncbi:MAG TPA: DUF1349 domain-containing protein [Pirellulales bacterium]|jgi:regulation of enolase protein 1 (concanavalin A-like superfamily)|nr:DUF1349 domain-containing protein [Pirellulales bacterium]